MTGSVLTEYAYDPFGTSSKLSGSNNCDFQYGGYFKHQRSGLNLTPYRAYNSALACWLSRDPRAAGKNLFAYVGNNPISYIDQLGLDPISSLGEALRKICNNPSCVAASNQAKCLSAADKIAGAVGGFVGHYGNSANGSGTAGTGGDPVNGYWCYDWAVGLMGAISSTEQSSFDTDYRWFWHPDREDSAGNTSGPTHWGVRIRPNGSSSCPDCWVNIDDGFGQGFGPGNVHPGAWGNSNGGWIESLSDLNPYPGRFHQIQEMPWPL